MNGIIFDIQKFALHDGPGIRTIVFLKGCPLECAWCSNPESQRKIPQLGYFNNKCTNCGKCIPICQNAVFTLNKKLHVNFDLCDACGKCIEYCPSGALKIYGKQIDVATIINEVKKDIPFYVSSGGGLTLSGGEPMSQFELSLSILKEAKINDIHTCLETSAYAPTKQFSAIENYVDLFLIDYKITDNISHQKYTSLENSLIIKNIDMLYNNGNDIVLRCVIVPGINDNDKHFRSIAELDNKYPNLKGIEIMPYHEYGKNKYSSLGKTPFTLPNSTISKEKANEWLNQIKNFGGEKIKIG